MHHLFYSHFFKKKILTAYSFLVQLSIHFFPRCFAQNDTDFAPNLQAFSCFMTSLNEMPQKKRVRQRKKKSQANFLIYSNFLRVWKATRKTKLPVAFETIFPGNKAKAFFFPQATLACAQVCKINLHRLEAGMGGGVWVLET